MVVNLNNTINMRRPVRIVRQPKAQSGFEIKMNPGMGFNANQLSWPVMAGEFSAPETEVNNTLKPTDWDYANLEAEKGETVVTNLNHDGIPEHYTIGGKRHYEGGTPLNLPPNSFIFSRDRSMKIKDEEILKMFGMSPNKKGYTPADIAKQYDINKFRKTLADPDSEDLQRETAEMMITNYNLKLGKLALVQESLKGFPQGIPMISTPYLQTMNINPEEFTQTQGQPDQTGEEDVARYGKQVRRNLPKHQTKGKVDADGNGLSDFIQAPGLNTTGTSSGSLVVKSKGPGLAGLFKNPQQAMEVGMAGAGVLTNIANAPERQAAEAGIADTRVADKLFKSVGEQEGDYLKDQYAGLHFRPNQTGQQMLAPWASSSQPGQNIGDVKYGGEGYLPKAQLGRFQKPDQGGNLGNFRMYGNIGGSGFFGPRSRMVGMRYNQDKGVYEAVNRKGEVIGFFNAGQAQGQGGYGSTGATTYGTSGTMDGTETTTTTKRKVKKQVIPDDAITEGRVIDRSKYDTEEDYIKARDEAFANAGGKKKVYTKAADGKYYTVGESDYFDKGDVEGRLKYLGEKFKDPKVAALLKEKMKAAAADPKKLKYTGLTAADIDNMKPEELADEFLNFNKRNLSVSKLLQEQGGDYGCYNQSGAYDGGAYTKSKTGKQPKCNPDMGKKYSKLEKLYEAVGMPMDYKNNKKGAALQQLSYIGYQDLLDDRDNNKIADKDVVNKLKNFQIKQLGVGDENIGTGKAQISPADSYYTNTTAGEVAGINERKRKEDLLADTEVEEDVVTKEKKKGALDYARKTGRAPWFIQDIVKSGDAFADWANINKEMPWMPMPDVTLPEGIYYDPNRQLAANSEASANILQNLAAFQGAQGLSSRASQIFGQTAKGAADILAQYNNQNVGVANNMELQRANILNQNAIRRTGLAKQLYDENAVANQQYRNAKNQAMDNIVNQWVSGKTNAVNAYNLNQMFPQYNTHPESGGMISFEGGRPITADTSGKGSFLNKYKEYRGVLPAGTDDNVIWNLVKNDLGTSDNNEVDPDYLKAMAATMQGVGSSKKANRYGYNNS